MGRLKKGGVPDQYAAARVVLNEWNCGKIKYYTHPPEDDQTITGTYDSIMEETQIVSEFAKEFSLDDLDIVKMESEDIENLPNVLPSPVSMVISTSGIVKEHMKEELSEKDPSNNKDKVTNWAIGKENLLSEQISIGGNADSLLHKKQV